MENFDATGMQDIARYAPIRVALLGFMRMVFGLLLGIMAVAAIWATAGGDMTPTNPGDMPSWWMYVVGLGIGFAAFCFITGGVGRILSAFVRDCFFRAGPDGVRIRVPKNGWFGRFRVVEYNLRWDEITGLIEFTHRINLIPVSKELRIERSTGETIAVERHFFSPGVKAIQAKLISMQSFASR